ncbi:MAG: sulfatase-like hydrolase/transferase, partial [Planctomycetota bacterium]
GEGAYGLVQWEITLPEILSERGYATGMFGKWHLGRTAGRFPTDQGFDEWYGITNSTDESAWTALQGFKESGLPTPYVFEGRKGADPKKVRVYDLAYRPRIDADLTAKGLDFMRRQAAAKKPFFLFLPYTATHFPALPHPDFVGKTGKGAWADLLAQIDAYVGRLIDETERLGIANDTIIIFTADNGPESLPKGQSSLTVETAAGGTAGPWRGTLFTGFEGALRVPFAMRWPGKIKPGTVSDEVVHAMDLFPTLAAFTGAKVPTDRVIDGVDQSGLFLGENANSGREGFVIYMGDKVFGVKWRNWKLHFNELETWAGETKAYEMPKVYNLLVDPGETQDVLFPNTWVPRKALPILEAHVASLKSHPPIPMGAPDPYVPPKR